MKKQFWKWITVVFLMALVLTACGKKNTSASEKEIAKEESKVPQAEAKTETEAEPEAEGETEQLLAFGADDNSEERNGQENTQIIVREEPQQPVRTSRLFRAPVQEPAPVILEEPVQELKQAPVTAPQDSSSDKEDDADREETIPPQSVPQEKPKVIEGSSKRMKENSNVLEKAIWRERLLAETKHLIPVKDFYFSSEDVTSSQMKEQIDCLIENDYVNSLSYVTGYGSDINLSSYVEVTIKEEALLGSAIRFEEQRKKALERQDDKPEGEIVSSDSFDDINAVIESMTDEEYAVFQLEIYEVLLQAALKCETPQYNISNDYDEVPMIYDYCDITYDEVVHFLNDATNRAFQCCRGAVTDTQKKSMLWKLSQIMMEHAPEMCFWLDNISTKDDNHLRIFFSMFGVYETVDNGNGTISIDKSQYKSIARMAKEVDDKLNQVVEDVIDPDMSMFAKEYALFHYCDTYYIYDSEDDLLGGAYARYDKPYTIGAPVDLETGKKDNVPTVFSTQKDVGIYTTAMTGWGICVGHANFFHALCLKAGILCVTEEGQGHAWNVVTISGKTYLVDAGKRSVFPHFNISHDWNDTYKLVDEKMHSIIAEDERYAQSESPILLYRAGYVENTTQLDGEWIYYINFDDNGSLYKINVDGSNDTKIKDSGTTMEAAYEYVMQMNGALSDWADLWELAQCGEEYMDGESYTHARAFSYRWPLGHNFHVRKENQEIIYTVENNPEASCRIPMKFKKADCVEVSWDMNDAYYNLGILTGYASVDTLISAGDTIDKVMAVVDGTEYPMSETVICDDGKKVEFTFSLPTDKGMSHHDLEILVTTQNGAVKREKVMIPTPYSIGIKERYLWNGDYYTIEGVTAKDGQLTVFVKRYMTDGQLDGSAVLTFDGYMGSEGVDIPFRTINAGDGKFDLVTSDGIKCVIRLKADEQVAIADMEQAKTENGYMVIANKIYLYSAEGFCNLAKTISDYSDFPVIVCADLDFSALPDGVEFQMMPTFSNEWYGNNFKMKGLNLASNANEIYVFQGLYHAKVQDVIICDSSITGPGRAAIIGDAFNSEISNLWIENVSIVGTDLANTDLTATISYADNCSVSDVYLKDVTMQGKDTAGGLLGYCYSTDIERVQIFGTSTIAGANNVGGIVGSFEDNSKMKDCLSEATIVATDSNAGGIIGKADSTVVVSYCMNYGNVTAGGDNAGGISGAGVESFTHVENYGTVRGRNNVGGIVGSPSGMISIAVNGGTVSGKKNVGGIFGYLSSNKMLSFCANKAEISGDENIGQLGGSATKVSQISNTLGTVAQEQTTEQNLHTMFGKLGEKIQIISDTGVLPENTGRLWYCRTFS